MKKTWKQPVITVVGRGKPEEHVLRGCKREAFFGGMYAIYGTCIVVQWGMEFPCTRITLT